MTTNCSVTFSQVLTRVGIEVQTFTQKLILCDGSSLHYTPCLRILYVFLSIASTFSDSFYSCTPRGVRKNCTPHAADLISCVRQNWRVHANHSGKI